MKRLQFIALVILSFCFLVETKATEEIARCNVLPVISADIENQDIRFSVTMDREELNTFDNLELAMQVACGLQKNNECFYSSECR
jgi:hypothetical protein